MRIYDPTGHEQPCERCGHPEGELVRYVYRSGAAHVRFRCLACGRLQGCSLPRALTGPAEEYPLVRDRSDEARCVVGGCENRGAEHHHFAPRELFGFDEAERWPTAPLCLEHHREWHRRMRRAGEGAAK